jgi:UPF0755 protein
VRYHAAKRRPEAGRRGALPGWFVRDAAIVGALALLLFVTLSEMLSFLAVREIGDRRVVQIPQGAGVLEISSILKAAGLVSDPLKFSLAARALGVADRLQAGAYEFGPQYSELEVLMSLRYGDVAVRTVTVPEGFRAAQIAELLQTALAADPAEVMALVRDPLFVAELGVPGPSLEGFLFPDSYRFSLGTLPRDALRRMVGRAWEVYDDRLSARAESLGMSTLEVFTLASIIETEAAVNSERTRVSAVYHNRLRKGMRLEADPTVRYATGKYNVRLYYSDLDADSPYNTYRREGLPPGPICSPGTASIRAALHPLGGCGDLFFVSNGDGTHTFSRTYGEHQAARLRTAARRAAEAEKAEGEGEFPLDTRDDE